MLLVRCLRKAVGGGGWFQPLNSSQLSGVCCQPASTFLQSMSLMSLSCCYAIRSLASLEEAYGARRSSSQTFSLLAALLRACRFLRELCSIGQPFIIVKLKLLIRQSLLLLGHPLHEPVHALAVPDHLLVQEGQGPHHHDEPLLHSVHLS